ncbi:MAG: ABC transporter ATP-binding protein [Candidatus Dormibacteria bacterium]
MADTATCPGAADTAPPGGRTARTHSPAIHTVGLAKRYGTTVALDSLNMTVPRGEVFGFLGPNGAGKTTAVKLLLGLAQPSGGEGMVLGSPLGTPESRRRVGYLPELFRYQGWLRASEVLALHLELARVARSRWAGEISSALRIVGLEERGEDRVQTFSKGMQQRLGLGVALLGDPELVLLDEPTSALDPVGRHDVRDVIRQLRERGVAVFLNSHLLSEVEQICDRVAIVDHGRVVTEGRLGELLATTGLRVRCEGLTGPALQRLRHFGELSLDGDWLTLPGVPPKVVPEVVSEIVALGGRVFAVDPGQQTLEERFLQLVDGG